MADVSQLSILLILLMEVTVLTWVEYRAWKTFYTPLCTLMLPYTFVLLVTTAIAGNFGYVPFNYDSIWVWIYGLPLFALPSYAFAALLRNVECGARPKDACYQRDARMWNENSQSVAFPRILLIICGIVILLLFAKLYMTLSGSLFLFGTDEFADDFSGHGLWAHIRTLLIPLIILMFYQVGKGCRWLWIPIILMLILQFVNMVKGTIVIPIFAALLMRLYTGKTRMSLRLILIMVGLAVIIMYFSIKNFIELNIQNIGLLQANGYTAKELRRACILEEAGGRITDIYGGELFYQGSSSIVAASRGVSREEYLPPAELISASLV